MYHDWSVQGLGTTGVCPSRRALLAAGGLSLCTLSLQPALAFQPERAWQNPVKLSLSERVRAVYAHSRLSLLEWLTEVAEDAPQRGVEGEERNALGRVASGLVANLRTLPADLEWLEGVVVENAGPLSEGIASALLAFPLREDEKESGLAYLAGNPNAAKVAQAGIRTVRELAPGTQSAIDSQWKERRIPRDDNRERQREFACALLKTQLATATLASQWTQIAVLWVKLKINRCL